MGGTGRPNECKLGFSPRNLRRLLLRGRSFGGAGFTFSMDAGGFGYFRIRG
jgi:hypothetical protein